MRRRVAVVLGGLVLIGVLPVSGGQAATLYAPSAFTLTFSAGERAEPVQRAVQLRCDPAGGDHPAPEDACREVSLASGRFEELRGEAGTCTLVYQPVTVTASGTWQGDMVRYEETFPNRCSLLRTRGVTFDF